MEKERNGKDNMLFRFAKSNAGKLTGIILYGAAAIEAAITVPDIINKDYDDAKTSTAFGVAELSLGTAIFLARKSNVSKNSTQET